jgi:hypothetical protein
LAEDVIKKFKDLASIFGERELDLPELEEVAELVASSIRTKVEEVESKTLDKRDLLVDKGRSLDILKSNRKGRIKEVVLISSSPLFSISISLDGFPLLSYSFRDLEELSPKLENIDAFEEEDSGRYILRLGELNWRRNISISVFAEDRVVFYKIFGLYDEFSYKSI